MTTAAANIAIRWAIEPGPLERAWRRKQRRILFRTGAYGRKTMKRLFRKTKGRSDAGQLPRSHPPHPLVNLCLYGIEEFRQNVIIGPRKIVPKVKQTGPPVPAILNEGATVRRTYVRKRSKRRVTQTARHEPRPYRAAAFEPTAAFLRNLLNEPL